MIQRLARTIRQVGLRSAAAMVAQRLLRQRISGFAGLVPEFSGLRGLEIGGPSGIFSSHGLVPVYPIASSIDNCNFAPETLWQGAGPEGRSFHFSPDRDPGLQFFCEASDLSAVHDTYDFLLASHVVEHLANPLGALDAWKRVLRPGGVMVLVVPHRDGTFDHRRPLTELPHLAADARASTPESDLGHLPEILRLHDHRRDLGAIDPGAFERRGQNNARNRGLHHHVFDTRLAISMAGLAGLKALAVETRLPFHVILVLRKGAAADNQAFLEDGAPHMARSPFPTDRAVTRRTSR